MIRSPFAFALTSVLALAVFPAAASADPGNEICGPDKSAKTCPKSFRVVELPDTDATHELSANAPFMLYAECVATKGGLSCGGWPREAGKGGNLTYEWSFEGAEAKLVFPRSSQATRSIECTAGEPVLATLTIGNGNYRATSSQAFICGASS